MSSLSLAIPYGTPQVVYYSTVWHAVPRHHLSCFHVRRYGLHLASPAGIRRKVHYAGVELVAEAVACIKANVVSTCISKMSKISPFSTSDLLSMKIKS